MNPALLFVLLFALTLGLLAAVVATGLAARRRLHIPLVAASVASLAVTIWAAERLGRFYDLAAAGAIMDIHLVVAPAATLAYLLPLATGIWTLRDPTRRRLHRTCALIALALTVLAAVTGTWMILAAEPLPPPPPAD